MRKITSVGRALAVLLALCVGLGLGACSKKQDEPAVVGTLTEAKLAGTTWRVVLRQVVPEIKQTDTGERRIYSEREMESGIVFRFLSRQELEITRSGETTKGSYWILQEQMLLKWRTTRGVETYKIHNHTGDRFVLIDQGGAISPEAREQGLNHSEKLELTKSGT